MLSLAEIAGELTLLAATLPDQRDQLVKLAAHVTAHSASVAQALRDAQQAGLPPRTGVGA